jgi:glycosyltransferase involved in cell wall biosynthesis
MQDEPDAPLRVAVVYLGYRGGGARFSLDLTLGLVAHSEVSALVVLADNNLLRDEYTFLGQPVLSLPGAATVSELLLKSVGYPIQLLRFRRFLRRNSAEAAIFCMHHPWNAGLMIVCRTLRIPFAYVVHDALLHVGEDTRLRRWVLHTEIALSRRYVCLSDSVRRQFQQRFDIGSQDVCLLQHGARITSTSGSRPVNNGPLRLLFFGRIVTYKGLDLLCDALHRLREDGVPFELCIAGEGSISERVASMRRWENVRIINRFIDEQEIDTLFSWADLLVCPYVEASQSGVVPLAFSHGVPVLCTPVGGLAEQVRHQRDGLLTSEVSAAAIASSVQTLHRDRTLLGALALGAVRTAANDLDWSRIVRPLIKFLRF